jgi:hypothetical protein
MDASTRQIPSSLHSIAIALRSQRSPYRFEFQHRLLRLVSQVRCSASGEPLFRSWRDVCVCVWVCVCVCCAPDGRGGSADAAGMRWRRRGPCDYHRRPRRRIAARAGRVSGAGGGCWSVAVVRDCTATASHTMPLDALRRRALFVAPSQMYTATTARSRTRCCRMRAHSWWAGWHCPGTSAASTSGCCAKSCSPPRYSASTMRPSGAPSARSRCGSCAASRRSLSRKAAQVRCTYTTRCCVAAPRVHLCGGVVAAVQQ